MIKVCPTCKSTWAGGRVCEACGTELRDPFGEDAKQHEPWVWSYIRLQYGARRGMIVRVLAFLAGPIVGVLLVRRSLALPSPWSLVGAAGGVVAGFATWLVIYWAAGKAVRLWVLRKGQVSRKKLAAAMLKRVTRQARPAPGKRA